MTKERYKEGFLAKVKLGLEELDLHGVEYELFEDGTMTVNGEEATSNWDCEYPAPEYEDALFAFGDLLEETLLKKVFPTMVSYTAVYPLGMLTGLVEWTSTDGIKRVFMHEHDADSALFVFSLIEMLKRSAIKASETMGGGELVEEEKINLRHIPEGWMEALETARFSEAVKSLPSPTGRLLRAICEEGDKIPSDRLLASFDPKDLGIKCSIHPDFLMEHLTVLEQNLLITVFN